MKYLILVENEDGVFDKVYRTARKPTTKSLLTSFNEIYGDECEEVSESKELSEQHGETKYIIKDGEGNHTYTATVCDCGTIPVI